MGSATSDTTLESVSFADAAHGWAVGYTGSNTMGSHAPVILATSNGGTSWKVQDGSSAGSDVQLHSVDFVDALHGWAGGTNGNFSPVILATSDGGATWKAQDVSPAGINVLNLSVDFADAAHGWAVGGGTDGGVILATSNGGATWSAQGASIASRTALASVAFADATHGWAVGAGNDGAGTIRAAILATSDGGTTWKAQDASNAGSDSALHSVADADAAHVWATGIDGRNGSVILATSDGGTTWKAQDASPVGDHGSLVSLAFVDAAHGWAVGARLDKLHMNAGPLILATSDGGATWKARDASSAGSRAMLSSVAFVDAAHGHAVGQLQDDTGRYAVGALILATGK